MESLELDTFTPHLDTAFRVTTDAGPLELVLDKAVGGGTEGGSAPSFFLMFRGPAQPVLPQRTYRLEHDALGALDIFIVPVGADAKGVAYQAVFA